MGLCPAFAFQLRNSSITSFLINLILPYSLAKNKKMPFLPWQKIRNCRFFLGKNYQSGGFSLAKADSSFSRT